MVPNASADAHLAGHYAGLADLKADFRNYNLFTLVGGLVKGHSVVEIGSGLGNFCNMLRREGREGVGIEPSEDIRALAGRTNPEARFIAGTAEELPTLITERVDTIVMLDVLEHIEDDEAQVQKIYEALKPGGQFIVVVPAYQALYGERDRLMGHYRRYSARALRTLLEQRGFAIGTCSASSRTGLPSASLRSRSRLHCEARERTGS